MPSLLKLLRNRKQNASTNKASFDFVTTGEVVRDLTAFSSTSKSSPSNSSSGSSASDGSQSRRKHFGKVNSSKIFRRVTSSQNLLTHTSSSCGGEDEASHVSSLTSSVFNETSAIEKIDISPGNLLETTLQELSNKGIHDIQKENGNPSQRNIANKDALAQSHKQIAAKNAKIRYLNTLIKELKSLYKKKLDVKDSELVKLRKEFEITTKELSKTKKSLAEAMEGHAKLVDVVTKKAKDDLYWFSPVLGTVQFN
jgi:hypothetical protein